MIIEVACFPGRSILRATLYAFFRASYICQFIYIIFNPPYRFTSLSTRLFFFLGTCLVARSACYTFLPVSIVSFFALKCLREHVLH